MEIRYERNLTDACMILAVEEKKAEEEKEKDAGFVSRMILENKIHGFLTVEKRFVDGEEVYRYGIASRMSLSEYLEHTVLSEGMLKQWVFSLYQAVSTLEEYLLAETYLLLAPELVFVKEQERSPFLGTFMFCLCPEQTQNVREGLRQMIKYFMDRTSCEEDRCARLCYEMYAALQNENFCLHEWMEIVRRCPSEIPLKEGEKKKRPKQLFASRRNGGIIGTVGR